MIYHSTPGVDDMLTMILPLNQHKNFFSRCQIISQSARKNEGLPPDRLCSKGILPIIEMIMDFLPSVLQPGLTERTNTLREGLVFI